MTVVQNPGRLEIVFTLPGDKTRRESIMNIRPTSSDQKLHFLPDANLILKYLKKLNKFLLFSTHLHSILLE
jgi:hypothetical protein